MGSLFDHLRLARQRALAGRSPGMGGRSATPSGTGSAAAAAAAGAASAAGGGIGLDDGFEDEAAVNESLAQLLCVMDALDERIGPMLGQDGRHFNERCVRLVCVCVLLCVFVCV